MTRGVAPTTAYLENFFQNQLCGTRHELKNRYLHLDWPQREGGEATQQVTPHIKALLTALGDQEMSLKELLASLGLKDRNSFTKNYLNTALTAGLVERTISDKPTSRLQRYRKARR